MPGGNYSMPNMTTAESVNLYAAVLDYLAKQAAGTANEATVFNPYLTRLGVSSWDEIFHTVQ